MYILIIASILFVYFVSYSNSLYVLFTENPDEKDANLLFSPSSILTGIGMLYRGMEGETRENVREIMGFPPKDNPKLFRDAFKVRHI